MMNEYLLPIFLEDLHYFLVCHIINLLFILAYS